MNYLNYQPLRDLLLVRKISEKESVGGIVLPDSKRSRFIKLEILNTGPDVSYHFENGDIVHAENMFEKLDGDIGIILQQYIFVKENKNGSTN